MTTALPAETPLDTALRAFAAWRVREAEYSIDTYRGEAPGLLAFVDFCHDNDVHTVEALTPELASKWKESIGYLGESTRATRLSQLRTFMGYCIKRGWIEADPTVLLRVPRPAPEPRERLNAFELLQLVDSADFPQHRIILALAANLALRQKEIKTLLVKDVNLDAGTIRVHLHKTREKITYDDMPVTTELHAELSSWLDHYQAACPLTPSTLLVPSQHVAPATGKVTYRTDRSIGDPEDVVKRGLGKLGWDVVKGEGIHTVRRSVARIYFDAAEAEESYHEALLGTMRLLHHDKPETTLRYIGVDRQTLARDRFLRGRPFLSRLAETPALRVISA